MTPADRPTQATASTAPTFPAARPGCKPRGAAELLRPEALDHASGTPPADVLRLSPAWTSKAYWLLVLAFIAALGFGTAARLFAYASGPAILWRDGVVDLTAIREHSVASIEVEPGDQVREGQLLARFNGAAEHAELRRLQDQFERQLAKRLADPLDDDARATLVSLGAARDAALSQVEGMLLRAPRSGLVGDIRVRVGQSVSAGDVLLTLTDEKAICSVWAWLPGRYRPELRQGELLRFDVGGYENTVPPATIRSIGTRVIGPREARRYLGNDISDAFAVDGPVVLVQAALPSCSLEVEGRLLRLHHGMSGRAEVRLTMDPMWSVLFPSLRSLFRDAS